MDQPQLPVRDTDIDPARAEALFRPEARLRSPILARRSSEPGPAVPPPLRPDLPSLVLPSARELVRPMIWAVVVAAPVLAFLGWPPAIAAGLIAIVCRALETRASRATFAFGDGFLPFQGDLRWPRGVQEDDDVRWNWRAVRNTPPGHARG